jgi:hypothetical protein
VEPNNTSYENHPPKYKRLIDLMVEGLQIMSDTPSGLVKEIVLDWKYNHE